LYNSIANKTAISYKANRKIGGNAPSHYLKQLENDKAVQLQLDAMDDVLRTHLIEPALLRADDFQAFYQARKAALLGLIERLWKKLRRRATHNRLFDTLADLKRSIRASLSYFQTMRDRVKTLLLPPQAEEGKPDSISERVNEGVGGHTRTGRTIQAV
jgi:hypothetical protein